MRTENDMMDTIVAKNDRIAQLEAELSHNLEYSIKMSENNTAMSAVMRHETRQRVGIGTQGMPKSSNSDTTPTSKVKEAWQ
tara:strand:- start:711 stop:953 length:243 start_codon:yes stop_codon:yes gene_type:complete